MSISTPFECEKLRRWFLTEKRELPWRKTRNPYAIWVSEIMLQQTQVAVVLPYYERWMARFPNVSALAQAPLDEVIKCWEGLGYYSRARHLHAGAHYVLEHFQGVLPASEEELSRIKGLGPYTIGALLSFAFHQKTAAVDGNVIRVLARYYQIEEDILKSSTVKKLRQLAHQLLPEENPWEISEGLIELGATLCQRKPRCGNCPLRGGCQGFKNGLAERLPIKNKKIKIEPLYRAVAVIKHAGQFLLKRGKKGEIMSDLYEFPYFEVGIQGIDVTQLIELVRQTLGLEVYASLPLERIQHGFTRFQVRLDPIQFECHQAHAMEGWEWVNEKNIAHKAFSAGHRRILQQLCTHLAQT